MLRNPVLHAALAVGWLAYSGPAMAQSAVSTTDLNVRAGPGPSFEVVSVIPSGQGVTISGCTQSMMWCQVVFGGQTGWAYANYLAYDMSGSRVVVSEARTQIEIPIVTPEVAVPTVATVGTIEGDLDASLAIEAPPAPVRTYVVEQPLDPVYIEGEPVIGATLPGAVTLSPIPEYEYRYAFVNGQRVLVEPNSRRVVYVVR